jgi:hypothetical protein
MKIKIGEIELDDWRCVNGNPIYWVRDIIPSIYSRIGGINIERDQFSNEWTIYFHYKLYYLMDMLNKQDENIVPIKIQDLNQEAEIVKDYIDQFLLKVAKLVAFI